MADEKASAKKTSKKAAAKKAAAKKAAAKKAAAKKAAAKKAASRKSPARKAPAQKATKKTVAAKSIGHGDGVGGGYSRLAGSVGRVPPLLYRCPQCDYSLSPRTIPEHTLKCPRHDVALQRLS